MAFTVEQMREALRPKITSKDDLDKIILNGENYNRNHVGKPGKRNDQNRIVENERTYNLPHGDFYPTWYESPLANWNGMPDAFAFVADSGSPHVAHGTRALHYTRWWLMREWMRIYYGVYEMSVPLTHIACSVAATFAPHCAVDGDDRLMVAYTPDPAAGEADRQIRTSLGKFLRKVRPELSDDQIRDIEAAHRADMTDEIDFLTGADAIVAGYMEGPDSCMKKSRAHWREKTGGNFHPVEAYDAPGFALAVSRGGDGKINGRAMTWVNPQDEKDKRYVRLYGDTALRRRLDRRGYRLAGFNGARLKRIDIRNNADGLVFVLPYVDPPGGPGSGQTDQASMHAIVERDAIRLISPEMASRFATATGVAAVATQAQSGYGNLNKTALQKHETGLMRRCAVSGVEASILDTEFVEVFKDNELVQAMATAPGLRGALLVYMRHPTRGNVRVRAVGEVPTFLHEGNRWVERELERRHCGYSKLSTELYPDRANEWAHQSAFHTVWEGGLPLTCLPEDVIDTIILHKDRKTPIRVERFKPRIEAELDNFVRITRIRADVPCFAHKDVTAVRTVSGRQVVEGVHSVQRTIDGQLDFERNLQQVMALGRGFWYHEPHLRTFALPADVKKAISKDLAEWAGSAFSEDESDETKRRYAIRFARIHLGLSYYVANGDALEPADFNSYGSSTWPGYVRAAKKIAKMTDEEIAKLTWRYKLRHQDAAWFILELDSAIKGRLLVEEEPSSDSTAEADDERFVVAG